MEYEVPYAGVYAVTGGTESVVLRAPMTLVPIPGIGVLFSDGLYVRYEETGSLDVSIQVFYT